MIPSFFSLFKRGRYYRCPSIPEDEVPTPEAQRKRKELERFTVAAIAFCLRHDELGFRRHFMSILRNEVNPSTPSKFEVSIEDQDLDLIIEDGPDIYVVEAKIHALSSAHQRPSEEVFWQDNESNGPAGYGHQIRQRREKTWKSATRINYVMLGWSCDKAERPAPELLRAKWRSFTVPWKSLASDFPGSPLATDLSKFLAAINITPFMLKQTESTRVTTTLKDAASAFQILDHTCKVFDLQNKCRELVVNDDEDGSWYFGMDLKKAHKRGDSLGNQKKLTQLVKPPDGWPVCWFGYGQEKRDESQTASVWFNSEDKEHGDKLKEKISQKLKTEKVESGPEFGFFRVMKPSDSKTPDREWFVSVFKAVGLKRSVTA